MSPIVVLQKATLHSCTVGSRSTNARVFLPLLEYGDDDVIFGGREQEKMLAKRYDVFKILRFQVRVYLQ